MDSIKNILLGISILLVVIIIHLAYLNLLITDFIGIVGIGIVIKSFFSNKKD